MVEATTTTKKTGKKKQVTTTTLSANPRGILRTGSVMTLGEDEADELIRKGLAREYDASRDARAARHREAAPNRFEDA